MIAYIAVILGILVMAISKIWVIVSFLLLLFQGTPFDWRSIYTFVGSFIFMAAAYIYSQK